MTLVTLNSTGHDQLLYEVSLKKICRYLYKLYMVNISVNCPNYMVSIVQISTVLYALCILSTVYIIIIMVDLKAHSPVQIN